jgi:hypothetical protein
MNKTMVGRSRMLQPCKYKVGDRVLVKPSGGRSVEPTIKAIVDTTDGVRLQV